MERIKTALAWCAVAYFLIAAYGRFVTYDDTDDQAHKVRSGLQLYTDHKTGCQWVAAPTWVGFSRTDLVLRPNSCNSAAPTAQEPSHE